MVAVAPTSRVTAVRNRVATAKLLDRAAVRAARCGDRGIQLYHHTRYINLNTVLYSTITIRVRWGARHNSLDIISLIQDTIVYRTPATRVARCTGKSHVSSRLVPFLAIPRQPCPSPLAAPARERRGAAAGGSHAARSLSLPATIPSFSA